MRKVLIVGNPNVGKSTLFNSLTKSNAHTGNFHGVTVEEKSKIITYENEQYLVTDLPGLYSLNCVSSEEEISKQKILKNDADILLMIDANSMRKNLYLALELIELGIDFKIVINNYDYFQKNNNKLNLAKLKKLLNLDIEIINAKKIKDKKILKFNKKTQKNTINTYVFDKYLKKYIEIVKNKLNFKSINNEKIVLALNGEFQSFSESEKQFIKSLNEKIVKDRYDFIDEILACCVEYRLDFVYGLSKLDKLNLNPIFLLTFFGVFFFGSVYLIFFLIWPFISDILTKILDFILVEPIMKLLYMSVDNIWIIEFFRQGIFQSVNTVLSFLPQVCLLFVFLTIIEDSGLISRLAYVSDDFLSKFGLNGKSVYTMLLGFGCNTMSTLATRNLNDKNLKIKTALLNPYISCMARLPVFVVVASALFGEKAYLIVVLLYLIGITVGLILASILNKTILPSKNNELLLEFAPLRRVDFKHILVVSKTNIIDFVKRVFGVVLIMGVIIYILTHTTYKLIYTQDVSESVLYIISNWLAILFKPIGLNSAGIVSSLVVGILAKELILSSISVLNGVDGHSSLSKTLVLTNSVVYFSKSSAISFLIFSLLYCPCVSNLAVLKKETQSFYMWFSIISSFVIAYLISFVVYQSMNFGLIQGVVSILIVFLIFFSFYIVIKKLTKGKFLCNFCKSCKK